MLQFKTIPFFELSEIERERLLQLTIAIPDKRSLFKSWLNSPNPIKRYASLIYLDDLIVSWAAISLLEGINYSLIGAFSDPSFRNKGLAKIAIDNLLKYISLNVPEIPPIAYMEDKWNLFRPLILKHNLKDFFKI